MTQQPESTTQQYRYTPRSRPAMYGTIPQGQVAIEDDGAYGVAVYDRPLTPREVYRFELRIVSPEPALPLYPAGTRVKVFNTGKEYELEAFDGELWCGDTPLRSVQDWYRFEPV